jgi:thiamine pyrophosphate-dependent acetolactate synthase large subunit-like protein
MKAAELLVKCLENEGVDYIFGLPGEENIDVMDALLGVGLLAVFGARLSRQRRL